VSSDSRELMVEIKSVSKKYCRPLKQSLYYGLRDMTRELFGGEYKTRELRFGEFWAVKDVSLTLRKGDALGLTGVNGSGKTSLLRMIAGLIKPDAGSIRVRGKVAPLLAAGVGFNEVLTGRENVYANMSVLGLSKDEIDEKFEDVVDFAETRKALDAPVRTYSSGMRARLGFACAVHVEPDILLLDEILAVGDIQFKAKCRRKVMELRELGVSLILVSHMPQLVSAVCDRAIYMSDGSIVHQGEVNEVMERYRKDLNVKDIFG